MGSALLCSLLASDGPIDWGGDGVTNNLNAPTDFNSDGRPDYLLYNPSTHQTVIWYLNNNTLISHAYGPTPWSGWSLVAP